MRKYKNEQTVRLSVFTLWGTEPKTSQRHGDMHASQQDQPPGIWKNASVSLWLVKYILLGFFLFCFNGFWSGTEVGFTQLHDLNRIFKLKKINK